MSPSDPAHPLHDRTGPPVPTRAERLHHLGTVSFDLVVVGGGITGSAIAAEAAHRGLSVALLEREDFGCGASGHTSKLLHGGLRYLAQGHVRLVREALRERARVFHEAGPAWAQLEPFLLPLRGSTTEVLRNRFGTWLYERLAWGHHLGPRRVLTRSETLARVPALDPEGLRGAVLYTEAIVDDVALTWLRVASALQDGAVVLNHAEVTAAEARPEGGFSVEVTDRIGGREYRVVARCLVEATGAWMGRRRVAPSSPRLAPSKGIHLVFRREKLPLDVAVVLEGPDRRPTFVLPYGSLLVVGTTDTVYRGDPGSAVPEISDIDYLLGTLRRGFPRVPFDRPDVVDTYAGVRPLLEASASTPSELSREDVEVYDPRGAVAVAGGKLTTHQRMAERVLSLFPLPPRPRSVAGPAFARKGTEPPAVPAARAGWAPASELVARLSRTPALEDWAELERRVREAKEQLLAETLEDLVDRRLHALTRREPGFDAVLAAVARMMASPTPEGAPAHAEALAEKYRTHLRSDHRALEGSHDD